MGQREQEHVGGAVGVEVVHHGVDPLDRGVDPALDLFQEVDSVRRCAPVVGSGECSPCGWAECAEDVALATPAVVDLLAGPLCIGCG
jgi:hypothetical protein